MDNLSPEAWSTELAAELQRLSGLLHDGSPDIRLAPGERRLVAVLFLDLKDYTGLAEKLDHETLHHLVRSLMGLLAREVEAAGGYVDKYEGDMIMALFGAGGYSEVPCQRAVSCGLKMLERVRTAAGILQRQEISLGARVGVSYGPVTVAPDPSGHLTATGDEVNVASRLQAEAGELLRHVHRSPLRLLTAGLSPAKLRTREDPDVFHSPINVEALCHQREVGRSAEHACLLSPYVQEVIRVDVEGGSQVGV